MGAGEAGQRPRLCVLAPTPLLTVEIESPLARATTSPHQADVHLHPGGQGLWVARMAVSLGAEVTVCGPFGGEVGLLLTEMVGWAGLQLRPVGYAVGNGAYVYDRREGERTTTAHMPPPPLSRHELDDLYGTVLVQALESDVIVVTGDEPPDVVPASFYGRIVRDLRSMGKVVVADLSGEAAATAAAEGLDVLKMSHEEVRAAGLARDGSLAELRTAASRLVDTGVRAMVLSRAADPCLVVTADYAAQVVGPVVSPLDHRGAGDSMTAGIAVGLGRGLSVVDAVRLGAAAGTLNVTRRGLGTGRCDHIERLAEHITVEEMH